MGLPPIPPARGGPPRILIDQPPVAARALGEGLFEADAQRLSGRHRRGYTATASRIALRGWGGPVIYSSCGGVSDWSPRSDGDVEDPGGGADLLGAP